MITFDHSLPFELNLPPPPPHINASTRILMPLSENKNSPLDPIFHMKFQVGPGTTCCSSVVPFGGIAVLVGSYSKLICFPTCV